MFGENVMSSKKALIKTVVAIFAIIFLVFVFILFFWLFKISGEKKTGEIDSQFSSLATDLVLKNFMRSPVHNTQGNPPKDLTGDVGEEVTNANLISWTCNNEKDQNYLAFRQSTNNFFDNIYGNEWSLSILYSNKDAKTKNFGKGSSGINIFTRALAITQPNQPGGMIAQAFIDTHR